MTFTREVDGVTGFPLAPSTQVEVLAVTDAASVRSAVLATNFLVITVETGAVWAAWGSATPTADLTGMPLGVGTILPWVVGDRNHKMAFIAASATAATVKIFRGTEII
jgi:hypothetical protein